MFRRHGETLLHPVTGRVLGTEEQLLGDVVIVRTTPEMSFGKVVNAKKLVRQGWRVRTLSKDEVTPLVGDTSRIVQQYIDDERVRYEPWMKKYAWRVALIGSVPAFWALAKGSDQQQKIYVGAAAGLWGLAGATYVYYSATEEKRKVPTYLEQPTIHRFGIGGGF